MQSSPRTERTLERAQIGKISVLAEGDMAEITGKKTICEGRFLRFVAVAYVDSSGATREWEFFERVNCQGIVVIVPVTDDEEVLLIRQFRPPVNNYVVEFPAGLNDQGETLEEAARRELIEETGHSAKEMIFLAEGPLSSGASAETLTAYLAKGIEFIGIGERDETEEIEVLRIPVDDLFQKLSLFRTQGDYVDLKILGLLMLARRRL
jgi:8-oxo-dGTP pyrophosphatase MutT (NUDIX family)